MNVVFEQLMVDKASREFTVSAGWIGHADPEDDWYVAFELEECLGDDYAHLLRDAVEDYRTLRPKSGQERWEAAHKRAPRQCYECDVICAWCRETVACIARSETRANRRDRKAEAAADVIVGQHLGSCAQIRKMLEESNAPVRCPPGRLPARRAGWRVADRPSRVRPVRHR